MKNAGWKQGMRSKAFTARPARCKTLGGVLCLLAMFCVIAAGCGPGVDPGPERFDLSGTVTFKGAPLPAGKITFTPDTEKGNKGPAGFATIENGRYDTSGAGKGTVGGPHIVSIEGYDGQKTDTKPFGTPIFAPHSETTDLPKETTTKGFEVPASAAENFVPPKPEDEV